MVVYESSNRCSKRQAMSDAWRGATAVEKKSMKMITLLRFTVAVSIVTHANKCLAQGSPLSNGAVAAAGRDAR